jgi:hypothetical protein
MTIEAMKLALEALERCYDVTEWPANGESRQDKAITALRAAIEQAEKQEPWCPDVCPITGLPFFMWIEHHKSGQIVPTYGGPYDSYTIPVRHEDGSYCRERYDHDEGGWLLDFVEDVGVQIVSDQAYVSEAPPQREWQGLPDEEAIEIEETCPDKRWAIIQTEAKLKEKNS